MDTGNADQRFWLRVPERIQYKVAVLTYKVVHNTAPRYLGPFSRVADLPGRWSLRSASTRCLMVPSFRLSILSVVGPSTFLLCEYGMRCLKTLSLRRHCQHCGVDLKPFSSSNHTVI